MRVPLSLESAESSATAAEKALSRALLGAGIVLLVVFFVPWVVRPSRVIFTWHLMKGGSLGRNLFLAWLPIAAANLLALRFLPLHGTALRAALAATVGIVPLTALCATPITFGQPPAVFPDTVGYGLLAAAPLIAFGLQHRMAHRESLAARVAVVCGTLLILVSLLVPRETNEGLHAPLQFLFEKAQQSAGWAGLAIYLVLPVPLAMAALLSLRDTTRFDKLLRVLLFYFLRFVPGLFLLLSFPAFFAEKGGTYRPYILFTGAIITAYFSCLVTGTSALLAQLAVRRLRGRAIRSIAVNS